MFFLAWASAKLGYWRTRRGAVSSR